MLAWPWPLDSIDFRDNSSTSEDEGIHSLKPPVGYGRYSGPPSVTSAPDILLRNHEEDLTPKHYIRSPIIEETESNMETEMRSRHKYHDRHASKFFTQRLLFIFFDIQAQLLECWARCEFKIQNTRWEALSWTSIYRNQGFHTKKVLHKNAFGGMVLLFFLLQEKYYG